MRSERADPASATRPTNSDRSERRDLQLEDDLHAMRGALRAVSRLLMAVDALPVDPLDLGELMAVMSGHADGMVSDFTEFMRDRDRT